MARNPRPNPGVGGFVQIQAFSKINLYLEVLAKRPDGYHDIRTVMQTLSLHDTITIKTGTFDGYIPFIKVTCDDPRLPTDERNLVTRAAMYVAETYGIRQNISIHIKKRIPVAAGLGGGSSDCAATLVGLNEVYALGLNANTLRGIGLRFGADVPFFIEGGTALAEGVGERITQLPPHPDCWIVLACLPIAVSTAQIFNRFKVKENKKDSATAAFESTEIFGTTCTQIECKLKNDLTPITAGMHPEINGLIIEIERLGATYAAMSGSGPSVFGFFSSKAAAQAAEHTLSKVIENVFLVKPERMRLL
jgi:4-diphosphocytidyl-2-C-methyl-D-erythritol kinase